MESVDMEQVMRGGLRDMAMTLRALNVEEEYREAVSRIASQVETIAEEQNPEALAMGLMSTVMSGLADDSVPMLVKMTLGRMLSELNIKLIEGMQSSGTV